MILVTLGDASNTEMDVKDVICALDKREDAKKEEEGWEKTWD